MKFFQFALFFFLSLSVGFAGEQYAANPSKSSVDAAINAASPGDTVIIPAGSATWSNSITLTKNITIKGMGIGQTVIDLAGNGIRLNNTQSRITGITFRCFGTSTSNYHIKADCDTWFEVDNCRFESMSGVKQIGVWSASPNGGGDPKGLIYDCEFQRVRCHQQGDLGYGFGRDVWGNPDRIPGTGNTTFIEDCVFDMTGSFGNAMDNEYGGHYVFRNNVVTDSGVDGHGITSLDERGNKFVEIYNNTFVRTQSGFTRPIFIRGGTARVFNNTFTGPWQQQIQIDNETNRSSNAMGVYPWPDQIGVGTDIGGQWPGPPTPFPEQESWPMYQWNNVHDGNNMYSGWGGDTVVRFQLTNGAEVMAQEGRDFFNGVNAISAIGYTPYPYPHPLRSESAVPTAPQITSSTSASATVGESFAYQINATQSPTSYGATGLPAGLSINTSTGLISGTTSAAVGNYNVSISATNALGSDQKTLILAVNSADSSPEITSQLSATIGVGTALSYQIDATLSPTSYGATGLPAGIGVDTNTGLISGATSSSGTFNVTISATNQFGTGQATLTLTVSSSTETGPPLPPQGLRVVSLPAP